MSSIAATNQAVPVVGGGISGMTAALEAADAGKQVIPARKLEEIAGRQNL